MTVQVLVATMHQKDHSILNKMNIQTDAIVANQCDFDQIERFRYNEKDIQFLSFKERGVGLNRNNALIRASADICVLADEDMQFIDKYETIVSNAFDENKDADVLIFDFVGEEYQEGRAIEKITQINYMRYGAARIAFRREKVSLSGVFFNQNFGGGAKYSCGEDTIFLHDCIEAGLRIKRIHTAIAELDKSSESTWFKGYNEKYFYDRGILHSVIYRKSLKFKTLINIFNWIFIKRHKSMLSENVSEKKALALMADATKAFWMK